jgi:RsiW-degrading membrane proteinase PrsW (M82 family)
MLETMLQQFKAFYTFSNLSLKGVVLAIVLALLFGLVWMIILRAWRFNKLILAAIMIASAILTWSAIAFIELPLQTWIQKFWINALGRDGFIKWLLLAGIPITLVSGLVQEAAKLVPVIAFWFGRKKQLDPLTGLYAGALSGAGFGIFEAIWVHNMIFESGWSWQMVSITGPSALLGFWERFFSIGLHIAVSALAGYGWAKGLKWQYFLIAAGLHSLFNYNVVLLRNGTLNVNQIELVMAAIAFGTAVWAFLVMRNCNRPAPVLPTPETAAPSETPADQ